MRISVRPTPNPNSLKFEIEGAALLDGGLLAIHSEQEAAGSPLGEALFALPGVHSLLIVPSFVTVTKLPSADWTPLAEGVERVLTERVGNA